MQKITLIVTLTATPGAYNRARLLDSVQEAIMRHKDNEGLTLEDDEAAVMDVAVSML